MNLLKKLARVSSVTLFSRLLGFVRDMLIARYFGASMASDAFFVAFKLPNLLRRLFAEGAFAQAFVPLFYEYRQQKQLDETRAFIAHLSALLGLALTVFTALMMLLAPLLVWLMAPGFARQPEQFALTCHLLRITLPYVALISLSSLVGSILNAWERLSIPALTPALLNLTFIGFISFLTPYFQPGVTVLAWATFAGGCLQLAYPLWFLHRLGLLVWPGFHGRGQACWQLLLRMVPAIFAVSVAQIALLLNSSFASFLSAGSVSWMYYADRLMEFPTGVLGAALGTLLLPSLSKHAVSQNPAAYSQLLDWGIRLTLLLAAPASVGLALLAGPLTSTLFKYGNFDAKDVLMTQQALLAYALGLVGLILIKVLAPGFFARKNLRTPVQIALLSLGLILAMDLLLVWPLKHVGLALSIGLGALFNAALLLASLWRSGVYQPQAGWRRYLRRLMLALLCMALVLWGLQHLLRLDWSAHRLLWLGSFILAGLFSYFFALFIQGMRLRDFQHHTL